MSKFQQNPNFPRIGAMMQKKELGPDGRPQYWLKINDDVEVTVNGKKVTALNIERPTDKFERMIASDKITPEEYEERVAKYEGDGEFNYIKFEFSASLVDKKKR
jgi:hypothetical protein